MGQKKVNVHFSGSWESTVEEKVLVQSPALHLASFPLPSIFKIQHEHMRHFIHSPRKSHLLPVSEKRAQVGHYWIQQYSETRVEVPRASWFPKKGVSPLTSLPFNRFSMKQLL